jgi:pimeloyl-ACP methyl ester carboxylesterase
MKTVASKDGTKIAYDKQGNGPVLILILGALNKRGSGKKLAKLLSEQFTVVSYDRRGRGDSTDTQPYEVEKEIDDIDALIDALGGSSSLYGHSSGGVLALLAAEKLEEKVHGVALYEIPYDDDPEAQKAAKEYRRQLTQFLTEDERGDAVALFVSSVGITDKQIAAMQHLPLWKSLTAMAPTLAYDTVEIMKRYPTIDAQSIGNSALVMYGGASPDFMAKTARKLAQIMPNAKLQSLEDQTHDVKPDVMARTLMQFLG